MLRRWSKGSDVVMDEDELRSPLDLLSEPQPLPRQPLPARPQPASTRRVESTTPPLSPLGLLDGEDRRLEALDASRDPQIAPVQPFAPPPATEPFDPAAALDRLEQALERARQVQAPPPSPPYEPTSHLPAATPVDDLYGDPVVSAPARAHAEPVEGALPPLALSIPAMARRLMSRWYVLVLGALVGAALAAAWSMTLPDQYMPIARVVLETRDDKVLPDAVSPRGLNYEATIAYSQSQVDTIRSSSVLGRVIENEDLLADPEFASTTPFLKRVGLDALHFQLFGIERMPDPVVLRAQVLARMQERLYVAKKGNALTIEIGFSSSSPSKAARITNAIARSYLAQTANVQNEAARGANENLTARLAEYRARVASSERLIEAHKRAFNLVESNGRLVDEDRLARLNEQLATATALTAEARSRVELAREVDVDDVIGGGLPSALSSATVPQLRIAHSQAKAREDRLAVKLGARHPKRREAAAELASVETAIREELTRLVAASEREFARSQSREKDLAEQVAELRAATLDLNGAKAKLRELEGQRDADRDLYAVVLKRARETGAQIEIARPSADFIDPTLPPLDKAGPQRRLITATGGLAGGGLAAFLVLLPMFWRAGRDFASPPEGTRAEARPMPMSPAPVPPRGERSKRTEPAAEPTAARRPESDPKQASEPTPEPVSTVEPVVAEVGEKPRKRRTRRRKPKGQRADIVDAEVEAGIRAAADAEVERLAREADERERALAAEREALAAERATLQREREEAEGAAAAERRRLADEAEARVASERAAEAKRLEDEAAARSRQRERKMRAAQEATDREARAKARAEREAAEHAARVQAEAAARVRLEAEERLRRREAELETLEREAVERADAARRTEVEMHRRVEAWQHEQAERARLEREEAAREQAWREEAERAEAERAERVRAEAAQQETQRLAAERAELERRIVAERRVRAEQRAMAEQQALAERRAEGEMRMRAERQAYAERVAAEHAAAERAAAERVAAERAAMERAEVERLHAMAQAMTTVTPLPGHPSVAPAGYPSAPPMPTVHPTPAPAVWPAYPVTSMEPFGHPAPPPAGYPQGYGHVRGQVEPQPHPHAPFAQMDRR